MSFITQDRYLINKLLKLAQEGSNNPQPTGLQPDPSLNFLVLETLINNLEQSISSSTFSSERDNTQLFSKDLENSYNFLHFLARNGIKEDASFQYLVIPHRKDQLNEEIKWFNDNKVNQKDYFQYPKPSQENSDDFKFWIHKNGINLFLSSLYNRTNDKNNGGDLMKVMIDKLLNEINQNSGQNIGPASTDKPGQTQPNINDNMAVDGIPNPVLLSNIYQPGQIPLLVKDLKDDSTFKSWVSGNKIAINNGKENLEADNDENICQLINVLYKRAKRYKDYYSGKPEQKDLFDYYFNQMTKISSQNKCSVSGTDKDDKSKDKKPGSDKDGKSTEFSNIDLIIRVLPLRTDVINIERINRFLIYVRDNIAEERSDGDLKQRVERALATVTQASEDTQDLVKSNDQLKAVNFSLNSHPNDIVDMLKDFRNYNRFLQQYMIIVTTTANIVSLIMQGYEDKVKPETLHYLKAQVGWGGSEGSSIAYQNQAALRQLSSSIAQGIRQKSTDRLSGVSR